MKAIIAILLLVVIGIASLFFLSSGAVLKIDPALKIVGVSTPVSVQIASPHGVRHISAYLEQNGTRFPLLEQSQPSHRIFWRRNQPAQNVTFEAGKNKAPNLKEGDARIVVEAVADDFRGATETASAPVKVILAPPRITPDDAQHYINQGGMELAVMTPGGSWSEAGVKVGQYTFRSFPLPGRPEQRFSMFADVRNYMYQGKKVDQQVHLGFDLSDTQNAPVHVANDGRVVHAADLGIYGNCVVVDHGYALQSVYGHMNRIDVKVGDMVKKDQSLGVAGATGLALRVHVHFSMQLDGVQINPREWWHEHWIHDRIMSKLDPSAAGTSAASANAA